MASFIYFVYFLPCPCNLVGLVLGCNLTKYDFQQHDKDCKINLEREQKAVRFIYVVQVTEPEIETITNSTEIKSSVQKISNTN